MVLSTATRRSWLRIALLLVVAGVLTLFTQVGGVALLMALFLNRLLKQVPGWQDRRFSALKGLSLFVGLYALALGLAVPLLAPLGGRVPLPCFSTAEAPLRPASLVYCVLGRNYAKRQVTSTITQAAAYMAKRFPGTVTIYLDAGFPFGGMPMLPHLSHARGDAVDLAFYYAFYSQIRKTGRPVLNGVPSPIGYWAYEQPRPGEVRPCLGRAGWLRWDFHWLQSFFAPMQMDPDRTGALLRWLADPRAGNRTSKILLEPHLKARMAPGLEKIRFQGCQAARHDDHLHIRVR